MGKETLYAKPLGSYVFSNRAYKIYIKLYDHGMAFARIGYKKVKRMHGDMYLGFDGSTRESLWDMYDCMDFLKADKVARRWFRKVLRPCWWKYLLPSGFFDTDAAANDENERSGLWDFYIDGEMNIGEFGRDEVKELLETYGEFLFSQNDDIIKTLPETMPYHLRSVLLHVGQDTLLGIIEKHAPNYFEKYKQMGLENIESLYIRARYDPETKKFRGVNGGVYFPAAGRYERPSDDEEHFLALNMTLYIQQNYPRRQRKGRSSYSHFNKSRMRF